MQQFTSPKLASPDYDMIPIGASGTRLTESVFIILRDLIQDRTGVFFADDRREILEDKLLGRLKVVGCDSFLDYFYLLRYGQHASTEWGHVHDAIAVPETFFWREMDQVHALTTDIIPQLLSTVGEAPICIWSAACASGEEPLTIAMALDDAGWFDKAQIQIVASDASAAAIGRAKSRIYSDRSVRHVPDRLREKHFVREGKSWQVKAEIHSKVRWSVANLRKAEELTPFTQASVVFCRNVFIYFSSDAIQATVGCLSGMLQHPAYLFLGVAESLVGQPTDFELEEVGNAFVYKRA